MVNSEIKLILKWTENCILTERAMREQKDEVPGGGGDDDDDDNDDDDDDDDDAVTGINTTSDLKFSVTDCKMYVHVVILQTEYQNQLCKELKIGISIDFTWSKYRS